HDRTTIHMPATVSSPELRARRAGSSTSARFELRSNGYGRPCTSRLPCRPDCLGGMQVSLDANQGPRLLPSVAWQRQNASCLWRTVRSRMSTAHRSAAIFHPNELSGERLFDPIGVCPHVTIDAMGGEQVLDEARNQAQALATILEHAVVGQQAVIQQVLWGLIGGGHVLLEGLPGVGKTSLVHALGRALNLKFQRVQFTPDLLPSDITGNSVLELDELGRPRGGFRFRPGPLFTHLLLADEINRASPRTQSALLEAMQEGTVTVDGTTHPLPRPFAVLATQNPYDMDGTFPLPEAQRDRFLVEVRLDAPSQDHLVSILLRQSTTEAI